MPENNKDFWDIVNSVTTPIIGIAALVIAIIALVYTRDSNIVGSTQKEQKDEIDSLAKVSEKLTVLLASQQETNRELKENVDSQSAQISQLKIMADFSDRQFHIEKTSLGLIVSDRNVSRNLDEQSYVVGFRHLAVMLTGLNTFVQPQRDTTENLGLEFEERLTQIKEQAVELMANKFLWSQQYRYRNLTEFVKFVDIIYLLVHPIKKYDYAVEKDFLKLFCYWDCVEKNDSLSSSHFVRGLGEVIKGMALDLGTRHW